MARTIDVSSLLGRLDADPVGRVIEAIVASSSEPELRDPIRRAFGLVHSRLLNNEKMPVVTSEQAARLEPLAPSFGLVSIDQPPAVELLLVAFHARATDLLYMRGNHELLADLTTLPERIEASIDRLEPGVIGEFLVETAIGAARSREVRAQLEASAHAIRRRVPGLWPLEDQAKSLLLNGGPDDHCLCMVWSCDPRGGLPKGVGCVGLCIDEWWVCIGILISTIITIIFGPDPGGL